MAIKKIQDENEKINKISLALFRELIKNSKRLSKLIWKEKKWTVVSLTFFVLVAATFPFLHSGSRGLLINELMEAAGSGQISALLFLVIALLIVALTLPSLIFVIQDYVSRLFWFFLEEKFELLIIKRKAEIDIALHEDPKHNDLFNRVSENGILRVQNFIDRQFFILQNIIEVGIASAILSFSQWWVFLVLLVGTLPELITEVRYGQQVWSIHSGKAEIRRRFWDLQSHFNWLPSLIELKIFQNAYYFFSIIKELFRNFRTDEKKSEQKKLISQFFALLLSQSAVAFAVYWFILQVVRGELLIGTLTFVLASIGDLRQALSSLFSNLGRQYQDSLFVSDLFRFLDLKPVIKKPEKGIILDPNKAPEIVFDNVTFFYPGLKKPGLKNFSLKISPGETVALVGANGAGKTTFVKLLCRFYDPDQGRITIDGHDLREIDLESWYSKIGAIFQDYARYHLLVKDAIAVGRTLTGTALEKVKEAAKASEADVFIEEWEKSYEQMLGKEFTEGIEPSIGQWQKLALARTFYRDPRILILDEPTAAIDAEAETKIFERLESISKDRTVIFISHRFGTVRKASKIIFLKEKTIKEMGSHEELMALNGAYARLFNLQAKGYK